MNNEQTEIEFPTLMVYQDGKLIWDGYGTFTVPVYNANHVHFTVIDNEKREHEFTGYGLAIHSVVEKHDG